MLPGSFWCWMNFKFFTECAKKTRFVNSHRTIVMIYLTRYNSITIKPFTKIRKKKKRKTSLCGSNLNMNRLLFNDWCYRNMEKSTQPDVFFNQCIYPVNILKNHLWLSTYLEWQQTMSYKGITADALCLKNTFGWVPLDKRSSTVCSILALNFDAFYFLIISAHNQRIMASDNVSHDNGVNNDKLMMAMKIMVMEIIMIMIVMMIMMMMILHD